jgi:RHS repeat-associated protein
LDQYGNVTKSLEIAYPRRQPLYPEQGTHHIIYSSTDFINQGESESSYFIGHVAQSKQIEVKLPDGFSAAPLTFAQVAGLELDHPRHNLFAFSRVYYDGDAYVGLPFGRIGDQGLATRSETLAFKPGQLVEVFGDKLSEEDIIKAGYIKDMVLNDHWWIQSQRYKYDDDQYYLPIGQKDPMAPLNSSEERVYGTEFDQFAFLPVKTVDPLQNETSAENDYLTMGPFRLTELNGNRTEVAFDALGFVKRTAVMGKVTENLGDLIDSDETATTYIHYDLDAYRNEKKPLWAQVWSREDHYHVNPNPRWLEARVYSDGFGREIQAKAKAEPGLVNGIQCDRRWIGSGWKIYNNKGWVVEQYEPFFSTTNDYEPELISGVSSHLFYDPLGRVLRTDIPDGTFTKVVFDPWQQTSYDANDTVADSDWYVRMKSSDKAFERSAAEKAMAHYNTPTIVHLDTLGRAFLTIEDNGEFGKYKTRSVFDIQGSVLSMQDPRGNIAFRHTYDLNKNIIYRWQMDSGQRFFFLNTVGSQMKKWDSRHHLVESVYDLLNRPVELWVTLLPPDVTPSTRLAEKVEYGEILADAAANNFRGKIFRQFDGAGIVTFEEYDFKGNLLKKKQQILAEYRIEVNWSSVHEPQLMTDLPSNSSFQYDALNRIIASITPDVSKTVNEYDAASLMKSIVLFHRGSENKREIVRNITYNAKNQREMIEYGNGVKTLYSYDEKNLRLVELKSLSNSKVYIDNVYTYDPIGNITFKQNLSSRTICYDNAVITGDSDYVYDAKYQLIRATGRELKSNTVYNSYEDPPFVDCWNANDTKALRPYTQEYSYDSAGNINLLKHIANGGSWQRRYVYHEDNNRLKDTYLGAKNEHEFTYEFDEHGNHISFNHLQEMMWDFKDQLIMTNKGGWYKIYYLYDTIGTRTRKIIETGSIVLRKESIYFQNIEMLNEYLGTSIQEAIGVLIIFGENQHVALLETQIVHNSISVQLNPQIRYQLHDHLGSSIYELSDNSTPITYEEHFPYGETAYHECKIVSNICSKKFRYSQKEKDVETGFYYYGARYYISGLTRWISCDSIIINQNSEKSENYKINNLYAFNFDNPILYFDIIGYIGQKAINTEINQTTPTNMEDDLKNQDLPISDPTLTNEGKQALEQVKFQYQNLKGKKPCSITKEAVEALAAQYRKKAQNAAFDFIFTNEKLRNEMMTEVKKKFEELKHKGKIDKDVEFPYPPEWSDEQKSFYTNWFIEKYQEKHKGAYVGDIQDIKTAIRFHKSDLEEKAKFITIYGNDILREIEKGHNLKAWWIFFYTSEYVLGDDNRQLGSMIWDKNWTNAGHLEKWFLFWRSRLEQRKKHSFAPT